MDVTLALPTADDTRALGAALAGVVRAGDLLVLTGGLGAGKTTLVQGLGEALGVRGPVTSPTFVIARVHPPLPPSSPGGGGAVPLVHVDAYRLASLAEVDDLDLDAALEDCVTVVEWGEGLVEQLARDRLEVRLDRPASVDDGEERRAVVRAVGTRWDGFTLPSGLAAPDRS